MVRILIIVVIAVIAAALLYAATRPDTFRVERSTRINASPEKLIALISDFHQWEKWSPWENIDPAIQRTYSGATQGPGAVYAWAGNTDLLLRPYEVLSCVANPAILEVAHNSLRSFLQHRHMLVGGLA
jgi:hypothetical protein